MRNLITLLIITQLFMACTESRKGNISSSTIICGEVINADSTSPKVVTVFPYSFVQSGERFASDITKTGYRFNQHFNMTHKHDVAINYNGRFYLFMAEPSDSIHVTIDAKTEEILFKGSKNEFNNQVVAARGATDAKLNEVYRFNLDADVNEVISQFKEKMQIIEDTLNIYCANNNINEEVKSYLLDDNLYILANYILDYDGDNNFSPDRFKLKTHEIFDIYNPKKGNSNMYATHITNLITDFIMSSPTLREKLANENKDPAEISKLLYSYTLEQPKTLMRDIVLCESVVILKGLTTNVNDIFDKRLLDANNYYNPKFLELYISPILQPSAADEAKTIMGDIDIESNVKYINNNVVENFGNKNIIEYVKERYKGKVIYIDIWATWCGPCMQEIEYAKDLHKIYKDVDNIAFVNLCLSSKADKWVESVEKNKIGGQNYFISDEDTAKLILSTYKLSGYPSYLLIDSEGKMVTTSAHRPSNIGELSEQLDGLL